MLAPCERPTRELLSMNGTRETLEGILELAKIVVRVLLPTVATARGGYRRLDDEAFCSSSRRGWVNLIK